MFSVLTGNYEAALLLMSAGARLDIQNSRKKTAADLARTVCAPASLVQALQHPRPPGPVEDTPEDCFFI